MKASFDKVEAKKNAPASDATTTVETPKETKVEETAPVSTPTSTVATSSSGPAVSASLQERVERAKMLVEQRKMEKEQAENDKEKSKEMERREVGKAMLERKRMMEEKELKEAAAQRRKDKEEERLAREKVKAQLEQDKLDKKIKFQAEKNAAEEQRKEKERAQLAAAAEQAERLAADRATTARIQFRLPDGSSQTQLFPADAQLQDLYSFVRTGLTQQFSQFSLSTTFPRRKLDTENMEATLKSLQMAPSATVLVLPSTSAMSAQDGGLMSLIMLIMTPFTLLWSMISSFFATGPAVTSGTASQGQESSQGGRQGQVRPTHKVTRQGGIGRLRSSEFSDDDMNTYNGNSTQQQ